MSKLTKISECKLNFIRERGYASYRKLYFMCKFFDIKISDVLSKPMDVIDKLLK